MGVPPPGGFPTDELLGKHLINMEIMVINQRWTIPVHEFSLTQPYIGAKLFSRLGSAPM